ncbi:MAG TPA: SOS response-associated peptidase [Gemmatimonadaceae bacterium]|nr:SOS response-associated peptidase [Gemmatimonadaceae bacterium]
MCGRSSLHDAPVSMLAKFHLPPILPGFMPRYNVAPSQEQWTILLDDEKKPAARQLKWGLVPSWADDPAVGQRMINARSDSVADKPSYKESFFNRRCLILADGYYEWTGTGKSRVPMFFHLPGNRDFALAGLWDRWQKGNTVLDTCVIITTDASPRAGAVHHRMPVILDPDHAADWLSSTTPERRLHALMEPYRKDDLEYYEVSSLVNTPANDGPECIAPAPPRPLPIELSLFDT